MTATGDKAYDRVVALVEELPKVSAVMTLRRQVLRQAGIARAHHDTAQLDKLYRETKMLAASLGIGFGGKISRPRAAEECSTQVVRPRDSARSLAAWRRGVAPRASWSRGPTL